MATVSFKDFSKGGNVQVVGNEQRVQAEETTNGPSFFSRLQETGKQYMNDTNSMLDRVKTGETNPISGTVQALGAGGKAIIGVAGDVISSTPIVKDVTQAIAKPAGEGIKAFQGWLENNPTFKSAVNGETADKVAAVLDAHPDIARNTDAINNVVNAALIFDGVAGTVGKVKNLATKVSSGISDIVPPGTGSSLVTKLTPDAEQIMQRVARVSKGKQASFEKISGESIGSFLDKRGIYGDVDQITQKLYDRFQTSKGTADDALATIQGTYRSPQVRTALSELEGKVERTSSPGAPDTDLARVKELASKEKTQGLTMSEVNEVKRLYERRVRLDYVKTNAPEDVTRATNVDTALRNWQVTEAEKAGLKNLPEINKETMLNKKLLDDIGNEYAGSAGNNSVSLTDYILLAGGDPTSAASFLVKKTLDSKKVQSAIAKTVSKNKEKLPVPKADFKDKLQLEAPKDNATRSSNNVPINLNKESGSTVSKREIKNNSKKDSPAVGQTASLLEEAKNLNWDTIPEGGVKATIPLEKLRVTSEALEKATNNVKKGNGSRTSGLIDVAMLKDGTFAISEGHHRTVQKMLQGDKNIEALVHSTKHSASPDSIYSNLDTTFIKSDPLIDEAKKYKSAEEFIGNQGNTVYRSTEKPFDKNAIDERGIFTSPDKSYAENWKTGKGRTVEELVINKDAKILKKEDIPKQFFSTENGITSIRDEEEFAKYAKENGYDGYENESIVHGKKFEPEVVVFNKDKISSKQQLTDLYNQAKGKK